MICGDLVLDILGNCAKLGQLIATSQHETNMLNTMNRKNLNVSVIPNSVIRKYFDMVNVNGDYRIIDKRNNLVIYEKGRCSNCGKVTIQIDGVSVGLSLRAVAYTLRRDNNDCDYNVRSSIIFPKSKNSEDHKRYFDVSEIECYTRSLVPWRNIPKVKDVQWSPKGYSNKNELPEQSIMDFSTPFPAIPRKDVVDCDKSILQFKANGVTYIFENKESMKEVLKFLTSDE